jgi:hypothetical protein
MQLIGVDCKPIAQPYPFLTKKLPQTQRNKMARNHNVLCLVIKNSGHILRTIGTFGKSRLKYLDLTMMHVFPIDPSPTITSLTWFI